MSGFRFSYNELLWIMNENMILASPSWLNSTSDKKQFSDIKDSLITKKILFKYDEKYFSSPIIEYLMSRMKRAKVWLAVSDTYFVYIDITVSLYNDSNSKVTITPYETPGQCFSSIQSSLINDLEYVFIVDESSEDIKIFSDEIKSIWEDIYEQRKNRS